MIAHSYPTAPLYQMGTLAWFWMAQTTMTSIFPERVATKNCKATLVDPGETPSLVWGCHATSSFFPYIIGHSHRPHFETPPTHSVGEVFMLRRSLDQNSASSLPKKPCSLIPPEGGKPFQTPLNTETFQSVFWRLCGKPIEHHLT